MRSSENSAFRSSKRPPPARHPSLRRLVLELALHFRDLTLQLLLSSKALACSACTAATFPSCVSLAMDASASAFRRRSFIDRMSIRARLRGLDLAEMRLQRLAAASSRAAAIASAAILCAA
jgi:hypothetical protein